MLSSSHTPDPALILTVPAFASPGVAHGFSTRRTGVPHEGRLDEALPDFLAAAGFPGGCRTVALSQVHGRTVHTVRDGAPPSRPPEADGVVTRLSRVVLLLRTADCVPVLLACRSSGVVGAAHAGWRGALAGVVQATLAAMVELGARRETIRAAIGPAIGPCCFQVGADVARSFAALSPDLVTSAAGEPHVDLPGAVSHLLRRDGLTAGSVHRLQACTLCRQDLFFSHRGEAGRTGRLITAISTTGSSADA